MSYEILITGEGLIMLHITAAVFDSVEGCQIEFHDGKEAKLYKQNGVWVQYNDQWLNETTLQAIGNCIDNSLVKKSPNVTESYFYDMLIN